MARRRALMPASDDLDSPEAGKRKRAPAAKRETLSVIGDDH
jgi:hypothetical protein